MKTQVLRHRQASRAGGLILTSLHRCRISGTVSDLKHCKRDCQCLHQDWQVTALTKGNGSFVFRRFRHYIRISCQVMATWSVTGYYVHIRKPGKVIKFVPLEGPMEADVAIPPEVWFQYSEVLIFWVKNIR